MLRQLLYIHIRFSIYLHILPNKCKCRINNRMLRSLKEISNYTKKKQGHCDTFILRLFFSIWKFERAGCSTRTFPPVATGQREFEARRREEKKHRGLETQRVFVAHFFGLSTIHASGKHNPTSWLWHSMVHRPVRIYISPLCRRQKYPRTFLPIGT